MRVIFVYGGPFFPSGAGWTRMNFFAQFLSKHGHSVEVLGAFSYRSFGRNLVEKFSNINVFNLLFHLGFRHPIFFIFNCFLSFLISGLFLIARRPDVVVVSVPNGALGVGALLFCRLFGLLYVTDYRDQWEDFALTQFKHNHEVPFYIRMKKFVAGIYARSSLVTTVTPSFVKQLTHRGVMNIKLVPNGADTTVFKPAKKIRNRDNFTLVYMISDPIYNRLDLVLQSAELLEQKIPNLQVILVGKMNPDLYNFLPLRKNIHFYGEISNHPELSRIIAHGDVGLVPLSIDYIQSKTSLPVKFFEYCACGLPVVATVPEDSILAKIINDTKVGLCVPSNDKKLFSDAIYSLYKNVSFRFDASKRARALIEKEFDRNKIADEFLKSIVDLYSSD